MNKLIVIISIVFSAACSGNMQQESKQDETGNKKDSLTAIQLNEGKKWKADSLTKAHVASMMQLVQDSSFNSSEKSKDLAAKLQANIDALVKDCRMQGADHEALHVWLKGIIKEVKELKQGEDDEYKEELQKLKNRLAGFYSYFE